MSPARTVLLARLLKLWVEPLGMLESMLLTRMMSQHMDILVGDIRERVLPLLPSQS
jgi:hypothetical protein